MNNSVEPRDPAWSKGIDAANATPRCAAKTRRGTLCQSPGMRNGRCRLHGGKSTGPRTIEGRERSRMANWKHGLRSATAVKRRKQAAAVRRRIKELEAHVGELLAK